MKTYQTSAGLGYRQLAFLIRLDKGKSGYNYLCIGTQSVHDDSYQIGKIVEDLEDVYVHNSNYDINESPLSGSYLFQFFVSNYKAT